MNIILKYIFSALIMAICLIILAISTCFYSLSPRTTIFTSSDGITWKQDGGWNLWRLIPGTCGIEKIAADGVQDITWLDKLNKFVAVGKQGTIYTSSDGINWRKIHKCLPGAKANVIWANKLNKFVVMDSMNIYISSDGNSWTSNLVPTWLMDIAWSDNLGKFVAVGSSTGLDGMLFTSSDGTHWSQIMDQYPHLLRNVVWLDDPGKFVVTGDGNTTLTSSDGITWKNIESKSAMSTGFDNTAKILWSDKLKKFVAVGNVGVRDIILTSIDGSNWIPPTSGINESANAITWSDKLGIFVVVGDNGIYTSPDGDTWTQVYTKENYYSGKFNTIIWSDKLGKFIAVHIYYPRRWQGG